MILAAVTLGLAFGCLTPRSRAQTSPDIKRNLSSQVKDAQSLFEKGDWQQARRVATEAIARAQAEAAPSKAIAELHDINAHAAFMAFDLDAGDACEAALRAWKALPNEDQRIARVLEWLGFLLDLGGDLQQAEAQVRRSIALYERLRGPQDPALLGPFYTLLDLLDQECRVGEAVPQLARVRRIIASHPEFDPNATFFAERMDAYIARREGDLERAIVVLKSATEQLAALKGNKSQIQDRQRYLDVAYDTLAEFSRDLGKYDDMKSYVEKQSNTQVSEQIRAHGVAIDLFFAYQANCDQRYLMQAQSIGLRFVSGGDVLFPRALARIEPCSAEPRVNPRGWLHRAPSAEEARDKCIPDAANREASELTVLVRVADGKIVAAEATGIGTDEALLRCVVDAIVGLPVAGPHDFNFITL